MRRLCSLTVKERPSHIESPISFSLPSSSCFSPISLSTMSSPHISPTSPTLSCICISPLCSSAMPNSLSKENVPFDIQGLNDHIRWTFVGHGGRKVKSHGRHGGIIQMRKKEERDRVFVDNKIPDTGMHKDRSHLYDFDLSNTR